MLYWALKRMAQSENTQALGEKVQAFYESGRLTEGEYQDLAAMLGGIGGFGLAASQKQKKEKSSFATWLKKKTR